MSFLHSVFSIFCGFLPSVIFYLQSFYVWLFYVLSFSTFSHSTFGHSTYGHSTFGQSMFGYGFREHPPPPILKEWSCKSNKQRSSLTAKLCWQHSRVSEAGRLWSGSWPLQLRNNRKDVDKRATNWDDEQRQHILSARKILSLCP